MQINNNKVKKNKELLYPDQLKKEFNSNPNQYKTRARFEVMLSVHGTYSLSSWMTKDFPMLFKLWDDFVFLSNFIYEPYFV